MKWTISNQNTLNITIMIYIWETPSNVLLQKLYNHNETRSEENKLTFPEDKTNDRTSSSHGYGYSIIYNTFWLSKIYCRIFMKLHDDIEDNNNDVDENKSNSNDELDTDKNTNKNTDKNTDKNIDIIVHDDDVEDGNVFDLIQWSVPELAALLRECDILTRVAGREMDKSGLMTRMKQVYYNTERNNVYKPSPLGHNWIGFWSPYIADILITIMTVLGTLAGVHYLYTYCEYYHYAWNCSNWRKMYSLECYVLKKSRFYLEEMNYNLVYTTLCGLGIALTGLFARAKAYATKNTGGDNRG